MPATLIAPSLTAIEPGLREEAQEFVRKTGDHVAGQVFIDVAGQRIALPPELSTYLVNFVDCIASGSAVGVRYLPHELTTTTAAEQIGVSRPTLMKMISAGEIRSHKIGSHTRLKASDVLEYVDIRRAARIKAAEKLADLTDEYFDED
jgi:excisionase family DNA binding protein